MDKNFYLQLFGYGASALIAVSLMMSSVKRLRVINLVGASCFATYGLLIHAYPVAVLNSVIVCVNIFHLRRLFNAKLSYQLLEVRPDSDFLAHFLRFYGADIKKILTDFNFAPCENQMAVFILRDCTPVGVFLAEQTGPEKLSVILDFVIPRYRNLHIGRFLFVENAEIFRRRGVKEIIINPRTKEFGAYLWEIGFEPLCARRNVFRIWVAG
jgi:Bacterial inner membrane protein